MLLALIKNLEIIRNPSISNSDIQHPISKASSVKQPNHKSLSDLETDDIQPSSSLTKMEDTAGNVSKMNATTSDNDPITTDSYTQDTTLGDTKGSTFSGISSDTEEGEISDASAASPAIGETPRLNSTAGDNSYRILKGIKKTNLGSKCDISPRRQYECRVQDRNKKQVIRKLFHTLAFEDSEKKESDSVPDTISPATFIGKEKIQFPEPVILTCKIPLSNLRRVPPLTLAIQHTHKKAIDCKMVSSKSREPYSLRSRLNSGGKSADDNNDNKIPILQEQIEDKIAKHEEGLSKEAVDNDVSSNDTGDFVSDTQPLSKSESKYQKLSTEAIQSPDSSSIPHYIRPSSSPTQQLKHFSYFEKRDHEEKFSVGDQKFYFKEANRLKHRADSETLNVVKASLYLESGLYFILTGITLEKDEPTGSAASYNMYKDTLYIIRHTGSRFRDKLPENYDLAEVKIIILSMRCQALLFLKLFKMKNSETVEMGNYLRENFSTTPPCGDPITPALQLHQESPSLYTTTASPACSSVSQSQHTPSSTDNSVSRSLYVQMLNQCNHSMTLINAHEVWDAADDLVERYPVKEFFITIERRNGPLTLHNSLADLVRYVKQGLLVLKDNS